MTTERTDVRVANIAKVAAGIPYPHSARRLIEADAFMVHAWLGNQKLPNVHRNIDVDELWIHVSGPPISVTSVEEPAETLDLHQGEMVLLPRGAVHTSDAPADPPVVIAIVEKTIADYPRWPVADLEKLERDRRHVVKIDLSTEIARFTPPWRYPQVELLRADGFTVTLHVRSEGSLVPRGTDGERDHVWMVLKGQVQLEGEVEGTGPILGEGDIGLVPSGATYRSLALSKWTAALMFRGS